MAIITQTRTTITADFSQIENQYQNNTFSIEVNLTDTTFNNYIVMLSIQNPQYKAEAFTIPVINGVAKLPYYCTSFLGTTTISLFGYKVNSDEILTTNKIDVEVVASNPTNIYLEPTDDNWFNTMKGYTDSMVDELGKEITPSVGENGNWLIGGKDTGVLARGVTPHIDPTTHRWFIGTTDTGILAEGFTPTIEIDPDTKEWVINGVSTGIRADGVNGDVPTRTEMNNALNKKADKTQLGTQVTYTLSGTTLTITTK